VTPPGIDPGTVQLVALRYPRPHTYTHTHTHTHTHKHTHIHTHTLVCNMYVANFAHFLFLIVCFFFAPLAVLSKA